jgi:hypothetical protein
VVKGKYVNSKQPDEHTEYLSDALKRDEQIPHSPADLATPSLPTPTLTEQPVSPQTIQRTWNENVETASFHPASHAANQNSVAIIQLRFATAASGGVRQTRVFITLRPSRNHAKARQQHRAKTKTRAQVIASATCLCPPQSLDPQQRI